MCATAAVGDGATLQPGVDGRISVADLTDIEAEWRHRLPCTARPSRLEDVVEIRRIDRSRRDRIATDALADVVDGDRSRQRGHRSFRGAIGGAVADADVAPPPPQ